MAYSVAQPDYVVVPKDFESVLHSGYGAQLEALRRSTSKQIAALQKEHAQALSKQDVELYQAKCEISRLKQQSWSWRKEYVKCRMRLESAEESAHLANANIRSLELAVHGLTEERERFLCFNQSLQEQVKTLTLLCQGQHRAKVAQQGQLACTDHEAKQLHAQLLKSHEFSELLTQRLAGEHAMLEAVRSQAEELQQQLSKEQAELRTQASSYAALKEDCNSLRASLAEEKRTRAGLDLRVANLSSELQACNAELKAAEQRLARMAIDRTQRDEQTMQEVQWKRKTDAVVIQELQDGIERLKARLGQERRDADTEQQLLRAKLEREQALRETLEQQCLEIRKQQQDEHQSHIASLTQLSGQLTDTVVKLQQANDATRRLHEHLTVKEKRLDEKSLELQRANDTVRQLKEQLASTEKRAAARAAQMNELEAALERSSQKLCQQVNHKDAAMAGLKEQLDQQRRKFEQKEAELRDAQEAHARQLEQFEKRLAQREAIAREREASFRESSDVARRQAGDAEAHLQGRLTQLQAAIADRDEQIKKLMASNAAEGNVRQQHLQQLQARHTAEVARLEARILELERQVWAMASPEASPKQVETAHKTVEKLLDHLIGNTSDDKEEDKPYQFLGMSQPHTSQGRGESRLEEHQGAIAAPGAQETTPIEPQLTSTAAVAATAVATVGASDTGTTTRADNPTKKAEAPKRPPDSAAEDEGRPAGRSRGHKAAKVIEDKRYHEVVKDTGPLKVAPADHEVSGEVPGQALPVDDGPAARARSKRRAAQSGQARPKAMAVALANNSEVEAIKDNAGVELKGPRTRRTVQQAAAEGKTTAPDLNTDAAGTKSGRPAAGRGRRGMPKTAGQAQQMEQGEPEARISGGELAAPAGHAAESNFHATNPKANGFAASPAKAAAPRQGAATLVKDTEMMPETRDVEAPSQLPTQLLHSSQPPTQPQQPPSVAMGDGCREHKQQGADFSQQGLPNASLTSIFSSFKDFELNKRNPLATLNPKVLAHAKGRARIVPFTSIQQWKIVTPSIHKDPEGQQATETVVAKKSHP